MGEIRLEMNLLYTWSPVEGAFCTVWLVFYSVYLHVICYRAEAFQAVKPTPCLPPTPELGA